MLCLRAIVSGLFVSSLVAGLFIGPVSAQNRKEVGTIAGSFDVTLSGSSSYTIPFRIAPGATGTEPKLAIAYDSQSPGGSLGAGWSIVGLSAITRGPKNHFFDGIVDGVRLQETDALYLDGQRLVPISVTGGGASRRIEFRKEIDDQSQIIQIGADFSYSKFIVRTKGGLTILFDGSNGSRVTFKNGPTLLHAVSRILDTTSNYIQFEYRMDEDGDYDVAAIRYTGRGRIDADGNFTSDRSEFAVVQFDYEPASRVIDAYVSGYVIRKKNRLKSVRSIVTDDLNAPPNRWSQVSRYTFDYSDRPTTANRFVLSAVHQFGEDDSEIAPTTFTYSEPLIGWKDAPFNLPVGIAFASKEQLTGAYKFVHFTEAASTLPDLLFAAQINGHLEAFAFQNSGGTWTAAADGFKPPFAFTNTDGADLGAVLVDLNGDGRIDLLQSYKPKNGSPQRNAYLAGKDAWKKMDDFQLPFNVSVDGKRVATLLFGRLLSAGRGPDLIYESEGQLGFLENTGTGWRPNAALVPPVPLGSYSRLLDVDCDGKPELVSIVKDAAGSYSWRVFRFSAAGWQEVTKPEFLPSPHIPASIDPLAILEINFPGSTCASLIASTGQNGGFRVAIQSSSMGWKSLPSKAPPFNLVDEAGRAAKPIIVDLDNDRRLDLIAHQLVPGGAPIKFAYRQTDPGWIQLGGEFVPPPLGSIDINVLPPHAFAGDLDGDNYPDIVLPGGSETSLGRVWKGSAGGFQEVPDYGPKVPFARKDQQDRGIRIVDLNGDGLPDVVFSREVSDPKTDTFSKGAFINTGRGWLPVAGLIPPLPFASDHITGNPVQFIDVDGDGYIDMLYGSRRADGTVTRAYYRNEACNLDDSEDENICGPRAQRDTRFNRKWVAQEKSPGVPSDLAPPQAYPFTAENVGDLGVRFVDLNGDGRVDMLVGFLPPKGSTGGAEPIEECKTINEVQVCELNRKLFRIAAFMHDGSSWIRTPAYDPPLPFVSQVSLGGRTQDLFVQIIDVDGDRLPDVVAGFKHPYDPNKDVFETWINTGSGWRLDSNLILPTRSNGTRLFLDEPLRDPRALIQWADVNGDGLADIVFTKRQGGVNDSATFLSTGRGFVNGGDPWKLSLEAIADRNGDPSFRLIDVNGDGLLDVLYARKIAGGQKETGLLVNNGTGWVSANKKLVETIPPFIDENGLDQGVRLFDVDGNGLLDVIQSYASGDTNTAPQGPMLLNSGRRSDILTTIETGYGLKTSVFYQTMLETNPDAVGAAMISAAPWRSVYVPGTPAAYPIISPVPASYVVRRAIVDESPGRSLAFSYRYGDFRMHGLAMRPLGFGWRESYNENSDNQILTRVELLQDVKLRNSHVREATCWVPAERIQKPAIPQEWARPSDQTLNNLCPTSLGGSLSGIRKLTETASTWVLKEGEVGGFNGLPKRAIRQILLATTSSSSFELDGGLVSAQTDTFHYDDNPDILKRRLNVIEVTNERADGTSVRTINEYGEENEARWLFGRLTKSTVVKTGDPVQPGSSTRNQETRVAEFAYFRDSGLLHFEIKNANVKEKAVTTTYERDAYGNVVASVTAAWAEPTRTTQTEFDDFGRFAISETNPLGHRIRRISQVTTGAPIVVTGPNDLTTRFEYDGFGRLRRELAPSGIVSSSEMLLPSQIIDPKAVDGLIVAYAIRTQTESLSPTVRLFDNKGRVVRSIVEGFSDDGATSRPVQRDTKYDVLGRMTETTLPYERGHALLWARAYYDRLGRVVQTTAPNQLVNCSFFASRSGGGSKVTSIVDARPFGKEAVAEAVPLDERCKWIAQQGVNTQRITVTELNMRRLPVAVTDAMKATVRYEYDAGDRLSRFIGPTGAVTKHVYDDTGQRIESVDPDMGRWQYAFDAFGRLVRQVDAKNQITTIEYDRLGRPIRRAQNDATAWWAYDTAVHGVGKIASIRGSDGYREEYFYDELGRQTRVSVSVGNETFATATQFDRLGRVARIFYPSSVAIENVYDAKGFLTAVRDLRGGKQYWSVQGIDQFGRVTAETYGNGIPTFKSYEIETGRPIQIFVGHDKLPPVLDLRFQYDLVGNLTRRQEMTGVQPGQPITEAFEYDSLDRLVGMVKPNGSRERYAFDAAGRITFKSGVGDYSYSTPLLPALAGEDPAAKPFHAVVATQTGSAQTSYGYDLNGNMVRGPTGTFEYTSDNRMNLLFADQARWVRFDYSPSGARYRQFARTGIETTETLYLGAYERITEYIGPLTGARMGRIIRHRHYISNGEGVFATIETNGEYSDVLGREYFDVLGSEYSDVLGKIANIKKAPPLAYVPLSLIETKKIWYLHKDQLGSVLKISDETGRVAAAFWYDPWGKRTAVVKDPDNARAGDKLNNTWSRGFTGHEHLDRFSLIHMNGRIYNSMISTFTSVDLINQSTADTQAGNGYSYARSNPLRFIDPTGYSWLGDRWEDVKRGAGGVVRGIGDAARGIGHACEEAGKWVSENWRTIVIVAVAVAVSTVSFGTLSPLAAAIAAGALAGAATGATAAVLYGGSPEDVLVGAIKGAVIGGASAGAFYGVGSAFSGGAGSIGNPDSVGAVAGHGLVGGARESAQGGDFWRGFASAAVTKASSIALHDTNTPTLGTIRAAVVGGTTAAIAGGKFENGAATGAFSYLFNDLLHQNTAAASGYHRRLIVRDSSGKVLYGFSFGMDGEAGGNPFFGNFSASGAEPRAGGLGNGVIYEDYTMEATKTVEIFRTTPAEDRAMIDYMQNRVGQTAPYNVFTNSCRTFCGDEYSRMRTEIEKSRSENRQPVLGR